MADSTADRELYCKRSKIGDVEVVFEYNGNIRREVFVVGD